MKTMYCAIGALAATALVTTSSATEPSIPNPTFWCWEAPDGDAVSNGHFLQTGRVISHYGHGSEPLGREPVGGWTPTDAGEDVANRALSRADSLGLSSSDPFAIIIQDFGHGMGQPGSSHFDDEYDDVVGLFAHWCDALPDEQIVDSTSTFDPPYGDYWHQLIEECWNVDYDADPIDYGDLVDTGAAWWWNTPWTSHGRSDASDFTEAFIDEYILQQTDEPDPYRVFFDTERRPSAVDSNLSASTHFDASAALFAFDYAKSNDSRWGAGQQSVGEAVLDGDDMYTLFDTGAPSNVKSYVVGDDWDDADNQPWTIWYSNLLMAIQDEAVSDGLTGPIEDATGDWAYVKATNYSCKHVDEGVDYTPGGKTGAETWYTGIHPTCIGETQSPVFYRCHEDHMQGGESIWDTCMRIHRVNVDAYVDSLDGADEPADKIIPWIPNIGQGFSGQPSIGILIDRDMSRRLLSLLRSRGIVEYILWGLVDEDDWDDMSDVQEQVWYFDVYDIDVLTGTEVSSSATVANVELRDDLEAEIDTDETGANYRTKLELTFDTGASPDNELMASFEVELDGGSNNPATVSAQIYDNYHDTWRSMDILTWSSDQLTPGSRQLIAFDTDPQMDDDYVYNATGLTLVRLQFVRSSGEGAYTVHLDSAQLVEVD